MLISLPFWFLLTGVSILGAIWGSFVAALCDRWPRGDSISKGRSACDQCENAVAPYDLIPVVSYFLLNGKCRSCGYKFGPTPVVIELASALMGALPVLIVPETQAVAAAVFGWLLLPLIILDFRHLWLPDQLVAVLAGMALLAGPLLTPDVTMPGRLLAALAAFASLDIIRREYRRLRGEAGMGAGDPKLFGAIGLWLGWQALPITLLAASAVGIAGILFMRNTTETRQIVLPFGSYLGLAAYCIALTT